MESTRLYSMCRSTQKHTSFIENSNRSERKGMGGGISDVTVKLACGLYICYSLCKNDL